MLRSARGVHSYFRVQCCPRLSFNRVDVKIMVLVVEIVVSFYNRLANQVGISQMANLGKVERRDF